MPNMPKLAASLLAALGMVATPALHAAPTKPPAAKSAPSAGKGDVTRADMKAEAKRVFDLADTNKDGFMSKAEFRVRMGAVLNRTPPGTAGAPSKEEAQRILAAADAAFKAVDTNGDGKLDLTEATARPLAAFDAVDTNKDGVVTLAEKMAARTPPPRAVKGKPVNKLEAGR
jgi:hypothetical protein